MTNGFDDIQIKTVSYFSFCLGDGVHRTRMSCENIEEIILKIESGENIHKILDPLVEGGLGNLAHYYQNSFLFEKRDEISVNGRKFVDDSGFKRVSKSFIGDHRVEERDNCIYYWKSNQVVDKDKVHVVKNNQYFLRT